MLFENWGEIEYLQAERRQLQYVQQIAQHKKQEVVVFCRHPEVVTLGRASEPQDLCGWSGVVHKVGRGGRATYHGPGQVVIYPLLNLKHPHKYIGVQDVRQFLRQLEAALIAACHDMMQPNEQLQFQAQQTGVWCRATPSGKTTSGETTHGTAVGEFKKVASIGVGVKKWCTYHGAAVNLRTRSVEGLKPCGLKQEQISSLEQMCSPKLRPLNEAKLVSLLQKHLSLCLSH